MERVIRQIVAAVQTSERPIVVKLPLDAARRCFIVIRAEVSAIARIGKQWQPRRASRRCHAHNASQRVRAIQRAVRLPQHLNLLNPHRCEVCKLNRAADIVYRHIIDQHLVRICAAAANRKPPVPPSCPVCVTCRPGIWRNGSCTSVYWR